MDLPPIFWAVTVPRPPIHGYRSPYDLTYWEKENYPEISGYLEGVRNAYFSAGAHR